MDMVLFLSSSLLLALGTGLVLYSLNAAPETPSGTMLHGLAGFALAYASYQWVLIAQSGPALPGSGTALLLVPGAFLLLEFGRRLLRLCASNAGGTWGRRLTRLLRGHIYLPGLFAFLALTWATNNHVASRYALLLPGALFAGAALIWYPRTATGRRSAAPGWLYTAAGIAFLGFAAAAGLVVPESALFPASVLNEKTFHLLTGLHVEHVRAALVGLGSAALLTVLAVTQRHNTRALRQGMAGLRRRTRAQMQVLEQVRTPVLELDEHGGIRLANAAARQLLGPEPAEFIGRRPEELARRLPHGRQLLRAGRQSYMRVPLGDEVHDGSLLTLDLPEPEQEPFGLTSRVLENTPQPMLLLDNQGRVLLANRRYRDVNSHTSTPDAVELLGTNGERPLREQVLNSVLHYGRWAGAVLNRGGDGVLRAQWLTAHRVQPGPDGPTYITAVFCEAGDPHRVQERLHYLAYYDALTGLPNRERFVEHLRLALAQARREGHLVALMFLDLDRFKNINDTLGHQLGDRVLAAVAGRLSGSIREGDIISRVGGDEFTMILPDLAEVADAAVVAQKLLSTFSAPLLIEGHTFHLTASIGISVAPDDGEEFDTLLKNADTAMYRAKERGRNTYQFYTADMSARFHRSVALENDLRAALQTGQGLSMRYQPQVDIRSGRIVGAEALVRWHHPRLGDVPPASFIPVAEDSGLIGPLGEWVLRTACRDARTWIDAGSIETGTDSGGKNFRLAVNVSAHQLAQREFLDLVGNVLREVGLEPRHLELELTETALMTNTDVTHRTLHALNQMGVELSIDDFGTGYSSLGYLREFTIDKLKIDQSFVRDMAYNPNDATIATSIIAMAHKLNLKVIAEGVETQAQLEFLRRYGCDQIQGFLFSPPAEAHEFGRLLRERRRIGQ